MSEAVPGGAVGTMRALVLEGPGTGGVRRVPVPEADAGQVVVEVERAGICGTDLELLSGRMPYLEDGSASYPLRPGHEWSGHVISLGAGVDASWLGAHVTGDTMIGCGHCARCLSGRHHVCAERFEIGIRGGWHGALAERLLVPSASPRRLPDDMPAGTSALVEPAGNAWRTVAAARIRRGDRVCLWGAGAIGLLCLQFALAAGAEVDVIEPRASSRGLALSLGARAVLAPEDAPGAGYDSVIDATNNAEVPALAVRQVEPGGTVVLVGLADTPSVIDSRDVVLRDVTVTGILAASAGLDPAIAAFAEGSVQPEAVIDRVVSLEELAELLFSGARLVTGAPKLQVDPSLQSLQDAGSAGRPRPR